MGLERVTIQILKPNRVGTGGGGKIETTSLVASGPASVNFYGGTSLQQIERGGPSSAGGPGQATQKSRLVTLHAEDWPGGWPAVEPNYYVLAEGKKHTVKFARPYTRTMQIDCEIVQ